MSSSDKTFTYPDDLSIFPKGTQTFLTLAHGLDWSFRWLGSNHDLLCIMSPDQTKSINVPRTNVNAKRMTSWVHVVSRHSDAERFIELTDDLMASTSSVTAAVRAATKTVRKPEREKTPVPETAVAHAMHEAQEERERGELHTLDDVLSQVVTDKPTLVSEKPWMVRRGGQDGGVGRMYESPIVIHTVWSDGSENYHCRHCGYENTNPRSVAAHGARAPGHPRREAEPEVRKVADYEATDIKHSPSAARRLTSDLLHALDSIADWQSMDREALARALAETIVENRPDREPAEPLTPEQIIARITLLVDGGRLAEMHQQVERTAAALVEQTEARNRLAGEVIRLQEERRALRDLLSEDGAS